MKLFAIFRDIIVTGSVPIDSKFRWTVFEIIEAVAETKEALHLHSLTEFDKGIVEFREFLKRLVPLRYVNIFYCASILSFP